MRHKGMILLKRSWIERDRSTPVGRLERTKMPGVRMDGWPRGGESPRSCRQMNNHYPGHLQRLLPVGRRDCRHSLGSCACGNPTETLTVSRSWAQLSCAGRSALAAGWRESSPAPCPHTASVLPAPAAFRLCELFVSHVKREHFSKESLKHWHFNKKWANGTRNHTFSLEVHLFPCTPLSFRHPILPLKSARTLASRAPRSTLAAHSVPTAPRSAQPGCPLSTPGSVPLHPLSQPPTALPAPGPCPFHVPSRPPLAPDPGVTCGCNSYSAYIHY